MFASEIELTNKICELLSKLLIYKDLVFFGRGCGWPPRRDPHGVAQKRGPAAGCAPVVVPATLSLARSHWELLGCCYLIYRRSQAQIELSNKN